MDQIIENYRDRELTDEAFQPLIQAIRERGIKLPENKKNDSKDDDKKGEAKHERALKAATLMTYVSHIRRYLIMQDLWHGQNYEQQLADIQKSNDPHVQKELEEWLQFNPLLRLRAVLNAKNRIGKPEKARTMSQFQRFLATLDFLAPAIANFNINKFSDDGTDLLALVMSLRRHRKEERLRSSLIDITDPSKFMDMMIQNTGGGLRLFCALLFVSGRRPADIYSQGCFRPVAEDISEDPLESYYCMAYTGLKPGLDVYKAKGIIPLLVPYRIFINGLYRFRKMQGHKKIEQITTNTEWLKKALAKSLKGLPYKGTITSRDFRAIYARYSIAIFGAKLHQNLWVKHVLMHKNLETSMHYTRVTFPNDNMERIQIWKVNIPEAYLNEMLHRLEETAHSRAQKEPWPDTVRNRYCLGMTYDQAMERAKGNPEEEAEVEKYFRGEPMPEEQQGGVEMKEGEDA